MSLATRNKQSILQLLITVFLVVVLGLILYTYIYLGMLKARTIDSVSEIQADQAPIVQSDDVRRQEIMNALANTQALSENDEKRQETISALSKVPNTSIADAAKRQEIIDALHRAQ